MISRKFNLSSINPIEVIALQARPAFPAVYIDELRISAELKSPSVLAENGIQVRRLYSTIYNILH